jgi:hypothetical protein
VKYQSPNTYHLKVRAKVKVFDKEVKHQVQGQKVNVLVPMEMSCHKEHSCEMSKP